jgi:alginate O-acetyltransferase complex protein AlgI
MLFNSIEFIIFFLVVLTTIAIVKNRKFQHLFLLGSSYFFFYFSSNYLLSLLIISTILDYYVAKAIWKTENLSRKKILLIISLAGNLGLLGFFKYADFAITQFNILGNQFDIASQIPFLNLALPIGISFYTFQTISYTVDVYRGILKPSNSFREFALFVSFFPQLVAGPIVRAKDFLPQLREKMNGSSTGQQLKQIVFHNANLKLGITIMAFGFFKKMFFADNIATLANSVFLDPIGSPSFEIWLATIAFGIQIYCDFSGYSDIAIGAALILGFKLPRNFNKPYFATSPSDFWNRWHISLSSWLRDYLYIPLGGNKKSSGRTYVNLILVMFLGGLWHGASWNFVVWGLLHGAYLIIHRAISNKFPQLKSLPFFKTTVGKITSILVMQYFVFLAWIPFRVHGTEDMIYAMQKFIFIDFQFSGLIDFLLVYRVEFLILILFIVFHSFSFFRRNILEIVSNYGLKKWTLLLTTFAILIVLFYNGAPEDFIYFKF